MTSRQNLKKTLNHETPDRLVVDFGATSVTGIHVMVVEKLRDHFGLEKKPVKVIEPYQMLGEIEQDLLDAMGVDVIGIAPPANMFGHLQQNWKPFRTFWGQDVIVPGDFNTSLDENGNLIAYPQGDTSVPPSARMVKSGYFFDAIERQQEINEEFLDPQDNLEEFNLLSDEDILYWKKSAAAAAQTSKGIVANFGGTAVGDIALVPAIGMKKTKGIRAVADWYMSVLMRPDYLHTVFDVQTDIAIENLQTAWQTVGKNIDVVFICGTDFGTQDSTFCGLDTFQELYAPYYKKMNNWIHENTTWKTFKHCCGAIEPFIESFIDCGFDILNPVQINAKGMDTALLKQTYGNRIVFWGGGVDTQKILPFSSADKVKEHVKRQCDILSKNGGFVFNTVHNIQANVPLENVLAMLKAIEEF